VSSIDTGASTAGIRYLSSMQASYQAEPTTAAKDDVLKSHFITREGTYKLMTLSEYSRPNRVPLNPQVLVSIFMGYHHILGRK
jgi:hypothetical protein